MVKIVMVHLMVEGTGNSYLRWTDRNVEVLLDIPKHVT